METTGVFTQKDGHIVEIQLPMDEVVDLYKKDPAQVYTKGFFAKMQKLRVWQREFGQRVAEHFHVASVLDLGCASGYYLEGFLNNGSKIRGIEYLYEQARPFMNDAVVNYIAKGDASKDMGMLGDQFDMVMSIEVAEHILPEDSETFVANITNHSKKYILFSAATPGQKGTGHINTKETKIWTDMFEKEGFYFSKKGTSVVRNIYGSLQVRSKYTRMLGSHVFIMEKGTKKGERYG